MDFLSTMQFNNSHITKRLYLNNNQIFDFLYSFYIVVCCMRFHKVLASGYFYFYFVIVAKLFKWQFVG